MHARRQLEREELGEEKLVILGSGWAAHAMLKVIDASKFRVTVVSPVNHFAFTPMLPSAATGTVEYRSMTESVSRSNPYVEYVEASARAVDAEEGKVSLDDGTSIEYDKLVCAVGVRVNDAVRGAEHCFRLKQVEDAVALRRAISRNFEKAARTGDNRLVTYVVVGGGPTGVELAGELCDFIKDVGRRFKKLAPKVVLVHAGAQLLQQFENPQRVEALRALQAQGVDVRLGVKVSEVRDGEMVVDDNILPFGIAIWCAGTMAQPFMETFLRGLPSEAKAGRGFVAVDDWLRVRGTQDIFALGDCARLERFYPQTAQVAAQQGAFLARHLNRGYDGSTPPRLPHSSPNWEQFWVSVVRRASEAPTFDFLDLGMLAYLGGGAALSQLRFGDLPLGAYSGSAAYLLWKSVYLVKQVATRNRVLVTFDWFKTALFGRDITRL
ncbi:hypothetical protein CTAYLR_010132 [Chrysophaeum taylorii]|uniref:NADH dehydrogenase n=1 Tax=Chrysophaeum taylorii TaxID=2483200 RepID=A0AAD7URI4_9STRA|nr:hypothetical protein CTAYLR_010132 [Chrysophaeum taylorii]